MPNQQYQKIQDLQIRLNTCDLYARGCVCDEFLEWIKSTEKDDLRTELCKMVMMHLVDLDRDADVAFCQDNLMKHYDYHSHLAALFARAALCKRHGDIDGQLSAFNSWLEIAVRYGDDVALSEGYLHRGKVLMQKRRLKEAMGDFNRLIPIAEKLNNYNLVAIALYYVGLVLWAMDHKELCLQKLREASEMAVRQHSQNIAMQVEVVRAKVLLELGRADVAKEILDGWVNQFGLML